VTPKVGGWHYADVTPISNTCSSPQDGNAGDFAIDAATATAFHVVPGDATDPFSCSLAGAAFDCPDRYNEQDDLRPSIDAVLTVHATAEGTFSSSIRGTGTQEATITCTGTACSAIGSFPCQFNVSFTIATL
jgi:hypothetical protein